MAERSAPVPRGLKQLVAALSCILFAALCPSPCSSALPPLCFERLSNTGAIYLQEHPIGGRAVMATQNGLMTLITLPPIGSPSPSKTISTWLNLTSRVLRDHERGLLSFAFHPKFSSNGRFFVSYTCDSRVHPDCQGPCGCDASVGCTLGVKGTTCYSNTIISEYTASNPLSPNSTSIEPVETRRVLTYARPFRLHNGGHIFFGKDGYLYVTSGDGGPEGDPFNLAQQANSWFGKIFRLDIDNVPKGKNYSIPKSNPFLDTPGVKPEVYGLGLRNPWRCDVDPHNGTILCADVGMDRVEEVNLVQPGDNFQWRRFEGTLGFDQSKAAGPGNQTAPLFQYAHSCKLPIRPCVVDHGYTATIGGLFYRANINKCLQGKFIIGDYGGPIFVADVETKENNGINYRCSPRSPIKCVGSGAGSLGKSFSWARDLSNNAYLLTTKGVHRVTNASFCGQTC